VAKGLGGGDARAQRGGEESGDGCGEDRARVSAFYRVRREAEAPGWLQSPPMKAPVTRSEEGGIYDRVKVHNRVKEGASVGVAPWHGRRAVRRPWRGGVRGGGSRATSSGEGGRKGKGCGLVGRLDLLGRSRPKGRMGVGPFGLKVEGKNSFRIKIGF
jgi:hypothetical protein